MYFIVCESGEKSFTYQSKYSIKISVKKNQNLKLFLLYLSRLLKITFRVYFYRKRVRFSVKWKQLLLQAVLAVSFKPSNNDFPIYEIVVNKRWKQFSYRIIIAFKHKYKKQMDILYVCVCMNASGHVKASMKHVNVTNCIHTAINVQSSSFVS